MMSKVYSKEEKENFVAGLWMFSTLDTTKKENQKYAV